MSRLIDTAKQIYNFHKWHGVHRGAVFAARGCLHHSAWRELYSFFQQTPLRRSVIETNPFPLEQVTRAFFYKGSTFASRKKLIEEHFEILEGVLRPEIIEGLYAGRQLPVWRADDGGSLWETVLAFDGGQRKEGLLSLEMNLSAGHLYQMIFWLARDRNGEPSLYIGAMQGPNFAQAREVIKETTKRAHRYRTKNLILYMTQALARSLGLKHIYAVSNAGYYAMNHVRADRKLKTDFGAFWEEAGGRPTEDARFYELPLVEHRKTMEEVPTRKRAVYRRRFAFQDDVDAQIAAHMKDMKKKTCGGAQDNEG